MLQYILFILGNVPRIFCNYRLNLTGGHTISRTPSENTLYLPITLGLSLSCKIHSQNGNFSNLVTQQIYYSHKHCFICYIIKISQHLSLFLYTCFYFYN